MCYFLSHVSPQDRGNVIQRQLLALVVGDEAHGVRGDELRSILGIDYFHVLPLVRVHVDFDEVIECGAKLGDATEAQEFISDENRAEVTAWLKQSRWLVPHLLEFDYILYGVKLYDIVCQDAFLQLSVKSQGPEEEEDLLVVTATGKGIPSIERVVFFIVNHFRSHHLILHQVGLRIQLEDVQVVQWLTLYASEDEDLIWFPLDLGNDCTFSSSWPKCCRIDLGDF